MLIQFLVQNHQNFCEAYFTPNTNFHLAFIRLILTGEQYGIVLFEYLVCFISEVLSNKSQKSGYFSFISEHLFWQITVVTSEKNQETSSFTVLIYRCHKQSSWTTENNGCCFTFAPTAYVHLSCAHLYTGHVEGRESKKQSAGTFHQGTFYHSCLSKWGAKLILSEYFITH